MSMDGEENMLKFKRTFIFFIQKCFLLPTIMSKVYPIYMLAILNTENTQGRNWVTHVLNFLIKGIKSHKNKEKYSIDGCLFALIIVYFHEHKFVDTTSSTTPRPPWVAHWTRELLVDRIEHEEKEEMVK
ncbi:hypothetical protein AHAS_Ahas12G0197000 [Arachis hypogaea]